MRVFSGDRILNIEQAIERISGFLTSNELETELRFAHGYFISLQKHVHKNEQFIEIHTGGYDDTLTTDEAIEWLRWELIDRKANGAFEI